MAAGIKMQQKFGTGSVFFVFCFVQKEKRGELKSVREKDSVCVVCVREGEGEREWSESLRAVITVARITGIRARAYRGTLPVEWLWHQKISHEKHLQFTSVISVILLQGLSILKLRRHCLCVRCNFPCFPLRDWSEMEATAAGVFSPRIAASGWLFSSLLFSYSPIHSLILSLFIRGASTGEIVWFQTGHETTEKYTINLKYCRYTVIPFLHIFFKS